MFTFTLGTFRFLCVSVSIYCPCQIIFKGVSFMPTNHGRLLPKNIFCSLFGVRSICTLFQNFLKIPQQWMICQIKYQPIFNPKAAFIISNVFLDTALAFKVCSFTSASFYLQFLSDSHFSNWLQKLPLKGTVQAYLVESYGLTIRQNQFNLLV